MKKTLIFTLLFTMICAICSAKTIFSEDRVFSMDIPDLFRQVKAQPSEVLRVEWPDKAYVVFRIEPTKTYDNFLELNDKQKEMLCKYIVASDTEKLQKLGMEVSTPSAEFMGEADPNINRPLSVMYFLKKDNIHFSKRSIIFLKNHKLYTVETCHLISVDENYDKLNQVMVKLVTDVMLSVKMNNNNFFEWAADVRAK